MTLEFGKLGLLHLMAISGFHFALIAAIFAFIFRMIFPTKITVALLIFLLSSYFFFLGGTPSIIRAWTMSIIGLAALLFERKAQALNGLGISFLLILIFDPLLTRTMGFQFSVAVTASILLFYPITNRFLEFFITKRSLSSMKKMPKFDQHCFCILWILREGLALGLAVNIVAVPMTLYYFNKFPVMSLVYNLFIPFLVSCSMFLLIVASFLYAIIPPLGEAFFSFAASFTHFMLNFIYNAPAGMNIQWHIQEIPSMVLILYLITIFTLGLYKKSVPSTANNLY